MDRGKRPSKFLGARNNKIYMDLKDIIREHALPFLPAKSLFRFRGVCRDWKLHISTPFFVHNQSLSFHTTSGLFLQSFGDPPSFVSIDPRSCGVPDPSLKFLPEPVNIRASSNGLLCCQGQSGDMPYYICNPVMKQWKKLPKPNANHGPDPAVLLMFEPSLLNFVAEYKLICAFQSNDFDDATEFEIYSSKEGSWKISGEINFAVKKLISKSGVYVNGVAYWQSCHHGRILAFDLTKDRSQLTQGYCGTVNGGSLGVFEGKLCKAYMSGCALNVTVLSNIYSNTMQMSSNARLWDDTHVIVLGNDVLGGTALDHSPVLFIGGGVVLLQGGQNVYSYELKTKDIKVVCEAPKYDARLYTLGMAASIFMSRFFLPRSMSFLVVEVSKYDWNCTIYSIFILWFLALVALLYHCPWGNISWSSREERNHS